VSIRKSILDPVRTAVMEELISYSPPMYPMAEVGVYRGGTLRFIAESDRTKWVFGFDTWAGLPKEKWNEDEYHRPGEFGDANMEEVIEYLADLRNVKLVQGIFPDSTRDSDCNLYKYSFVHIDLDFYQSVYDAIEWFWPRMAHGGIILFDDYKWTNCPGVEKAIIAYGLSVHEEIHPYISQAWAIK
jgi:O-methyltransferase